MKLGPDRKKEIDDKLLRLLTGKVLPLSLVDNQHFKAFVAALDPRYQLPARKTVVARLEQKKEDVENKIRNELRSVEGIGITHDGWTSNATESYNTTTIHYIHDWVLKCAVLNTIKMEGSHTSEKIAESLLLTKAKWNFPENLVATTDNAANEKKAFEILGWHRFGCYGHKINLVVKNALAIPEMSRILAKSRKLVTLFHTSTSVNDRLMEKQKLLLAEDIHGHKLIADVPTRWNSTLEMLKRILEQLPALMAVATDETVSKTARTTIQNSLLTFDETTLAEHAVAVLEPFKRATETVCSEKNPTINKVLPMVTKLSRVIEANDNDIAAIRVLKKKMREQMDQRATREDLLLLGSILNPYTKGFEHVPEERVRAEELLTSAVQMHAHVVTIKEEKLEDPQIPGQPTAAEPELPRLPAELLDDVQEADSEIKCEKDELPPIKKPKLASADTDDWLSDVMCVGESRATTDDIIKEEISRYLRLTLKEGSKTPTVLEWWKSNEIYFPRIARVAKRVLCAQASSVPSERVFSLAGEIVSKKKSRLTPQNVDMFILLNKNMGRFW